MRIQTCIAAALTAAALLSNPTIATAQPATPPTAADKEVARNAMDDGDKKRDLGDLKSALASYEKADKIMGVPSTGIEVGRTQIALGMLIEAQVTLTRVAKSPAKPGEPGPFAAARKAADQLLGDLPARIPSVIITLTNAEASQPGQTATMKLDGEDVPAAEATAGRKVNPGSHSLVVTLGTFEKKSDFTIAERESKTVTVDMKDPKAAQPPPPPPEKMTLTPPKLMMFGGFGLAAIGLGVGAVTGIMSISKTSDLKDNCKNDRCPPGSQDKIDSAKSLGNISTIAFIVGGVGAGVGVVGLVLSGREKKEEAPPAAAFAPQRIRAVLGPSYAGISGQF